MTGGLADDDARWSMALSLPRRAPTQGAEMRLRRVRRKRGLLVVGVILLVLGITLLAVLLLHDAGVGKTSQEGSVPAWVEVVAGTLRVLSGVLLITSVVMVLRMLRRTERWRTSIDVLTFRQRRELVQQVRGKVPLVPERLPLVRAQAALLADQWFALVLVAALALNVAAGTVRDPDTWQLVAAAGGALLFAVALVVGRRDRARARGFLERHPEPEGVGS